MLKVVLWTLAITAVLAVAGYFVLRWLALRIAHRIADIAEARIASRLATGVRAGTARRASTVTIVSDDQRRRVLAELDRFAWLMDGVIPLPLVGGVGLDALLGLVPVAGDLLSFLMSVTLIVRAAQLGAPPELLSRLIAIQCVDLLIGAVPVIGDVADAGYHANEKSVALIREWLARATFS